MYIAYILVNQNKLYSLDDETLAYIQTVPKNKRSQTVREALKLHKLQHREKKDMKNIPKPQAEVKIIG